MTSSPLLPDFLDTPTKRRRRYHQQVRLLNRIYHSPSYDIPRLPYWFYALCFCASLGVIIIL